MNMLQPWIIAAIIIAALNWKLVVKFFDCQFWPRLGWNDCEFHDMEVRIPSGLIRWGVTIITFSIILVVSKPAGYIMLGVFLLFMGIANFASYVMPTAVRSWLKNTKSAYESEPRYSGRQRVLSICYSLGHVLFFFSALLWQFIPANISENAYVKAQTIPVSQIDKLSTKLVAVKQVNEIMRNGTTWFEIQAHWEPGVVYQVKEHPDYNTALKALASVSYSKPSRDNLVEIKWSSANVGHATIRNDLVVTDESPKVVLVTHLVCQE